MAVAHVDRSSWATTIYAEFLNVSASRIRRGVWHIHRLTARRPRFFSQILMSSPTSPVLQQLDRLNRSSPDFHDQLSKVLYGEEYTQCARNLQNGELVWLVEYLDNVRRYVAFPLPRTPLQPA